MTSINLYLQHTKRQPVADLPLVTAASPFTPTTFTFFRLSLFIPFNNQQQREGVSSVS